MLFEKNPIKNEWNRARNITQNQNLQGVHTLIVREKGDIIRFAIFNSKDWLFRHFLYGNLSFSAFLWKQSLYSLIFVCFFPLSFSKFGTPCTIAETTTQRIYFKCNRFSYVHTIIKHYEKRMNLIYSEGFKVSFFIFLSTFVCHSNCKASKALLFSKYFNKLRYTVKKIVICSDWKCHFQLRVNFVFLSYHFRKITNLFRLLLEKWWLKMMMAKHVRKEKNVSKTA